MGGCADRVTARAHRRCDDLVGRRSVAVVTVGAGHSRCCPPRVLKALVPEHKPVLSLEHSYVAVR